MTTDLDLGGGLGAHVEAPDVIGASLPRLPASGRQLTRPFRRVWVRVTNRSEDASRAIDLTVEICKAFGGGDRPVLKVPSLEPGQTWVGQADLSLNDEILKRQDQTAEEYGRVSWDGGEWTWPVRVLSRQEWSLSDPHRISLAGWVSPHNQSVMDLHHDCFPSGGDPLAPEEALRQLYEYLAREWRITYRPPAPNANNTGQRIREPEEVLSDPRGKTGEGTCVELALLMASVLLRMGASPVVGLLKTNATDGYQHAIVGVGTIGAATLRRKEALSAFGAGFEWVEATGVCVGRKYRLEYQKAVGRAHDQASQAVVDSLYILDPARCQREYGIAWIRAGLVNGFYPPYRAAAAPFLIVLAAVELGCAGYPPSILDQHALHRAWLAGEAGSSGLERLRRCAEGRFEGLTAEVTAYDGDLLETLKATPARAVVASDAELGLGTDLTLLRYADGKWCWRKPFETPGMGEEPPQDRVLQRGAAALLLARRSD